MQCVSFCMQTMCITNNIDCFFSTQIEGAEFLYVKHQQQFNIEYGGDKKNLLDKKIDI